MPYDFLPQVDTCCIWVKDLRRAVILISVASIIRGYKYVNLYSDNEWCENLFRETLVTPFSFLLIVCSLLLITVSFAVGLFVLTGVNWPLILDIYLTTVFTLIILCVFHSVLASLRLSASSFSCRKTNIPGNTKDSLTRSLLFDSLPCAVYMTYFAIVVNSYALQTE